MTAPDINPLRYFFAHGETLDQMRDHARKHPLAREGDMKLVWVNEGDLYDHAHPLAALEPVAAPDPAAIREAAMKIALMIELEAALPTSTTTKSKAEAVEAIILALVQKGAADDRA